MYEMVKWVFAALSFADMLACAGLMMYLALNRSTDVLLDRQYEVKRAWAVKWLIRAVIGLVIAFGLLLADGLLNLS